MECRYTDDASAVRYCTRCGARRRTGEPPELRGFQINNELRTAWRSVTPAHGPHGPCRLRLEAGRSPVLWLTDGVSAYLLTADAATARLDRLDMRPPAPRGESVLENLALAGLQAIQATPVGVFIVEGGILKGLVSLPGGNERPRSLLPDDAVVVGFASGADERIYALARQERRLVLYAGSGAGPMRVLATSAVQALGDWFELCVNAELGRAAFWGWGQVGAIDFDRSELSVAGDGRAPEFEAPLHRRLPLSGRLKGSVGGALPVVAREAAGWGLLCARSGRFTPASIPFDQIRAASGVGATRIFAISEEAPILLSEPAASDAALTTRRPSGWARAGLAQGCVTVADRQVLALARAGSEALSVLWFGLDADNPPALAQDFSLAQGATPAVTPSLSPLVLRDTLAVAATLNGELLIWLAPRTP